MLRAVSGLSGSILIDMTNTSDSAKGAAAVGRGVVAVENLYALISQPQRDDLRFVVNGYFAGQDGQASEWYWSAGRPKTDHDGRRVISPTVPWTGTQATQADWMAGTGETDPTGLGCFVMSDAANRTVPARAGVTGLTSFGSRVLRVFGGIDSLTDGAGSNGGASTDSYFNFLSNSLRAHFGDAGAGWTGFDNRVAARELMNFSRSAGLGYIKDLAKDAAPAIYSLDFTGVHGGSADVGDYVILGFTGEGKADRDWDTATLYYLQQPGGATIDFYQIGTGQVKSSIATDGVLSLQTFEITKVGSRQNQIRVDVTAAGACTLFGIFWKRDVESGVICSRTALGGYKTQEFASLDEAMQTQWWELMAPDLYIFNGGRNDVGTRTPEQFAADMDTLLSRLPATTQKLLISANESSTDNTTDATTIRRYRSLMYKWAVANGAGYINNAEVLGNYQEAVRQGWMLDATHPNGAGNAVIAANVLNYMGVPFHAWTAPVAYIGAATEPPVPSGALPSATVTDVAAGQTATVIELTCDAGAFYLVDMIVTVKNVSGSGVRASRILARVTASTSGIAAVGTATITEIYSDGMADTYTLAASLNGANLKIAITAGGSNTLGLLATAHGHYYAVGSVPVGGERWRVA